MATATILYFNAKHNISAADRKRFIKFCRNVVSLLLEINHVTKIEKSSKFKMAVVTILNVVHHL